MYVVPAGHDEGGGGGGCGGGGAGGGGDESVKMTYPLPVFDADALVNTPYDPPPPPPPSPRLGVPSKQAL